MPVSARAFTHSPSERSFFFSRLSQKAHTIALYRQEPIVINAVGEANMTEGKTGTDQDLIANCLGGDSDDFRHLVSRYQRPVFAYLRGRLRDPDHAQEAVQETFVRAFFNLVKLKKRDSLFPWLLGIAGHVARESDRRERRDRALSAEYVEQGRAAQGGSRWEDRPLEAAVASLPTALREVILLRFYSGFSCLEIAQLLDLPLGTVTKRLSRAYFKIRKSIETKERQCARTLPDNS
jgi:RNA polymerase sigma factor (sigma-70 family)